MNPLVLLAALLTLLTALCGRALWRCGVLRLPLDLPTPRKDHRRPMLLGGVLLLPVLAVTAWQLARSGGSGWASGLCALLGLLLAALVGFVDDWNKDRFAWQHKLLGQMAAALLGALALVPDGSATDVLLRAAWIVLLVNAVNFVDNTDGVALAAVVAPCLLLASRGPQATGVAAACLAGGCLGLLPLNWPRPVLFLGDAGSHALGFALGLLTLALGERAGARMLLIPACVPLLDLAQVLLLRALQRQPLWQADHQHLAHHAHAAGLPRQLIAPIAALLSAAVLAPAM